MWRSGLWDVIATGLVLWTVKRRRQLLTIDKPDWGFWLVEKLEYCHTGGIAFSDDRFFMAQSSIAS